MPAARSPSWAGAPSGSAPTRRRPSAPGDRDHPYGIDLAAFLAATDALAVRIEAHGLAGIPTADLRPGLITAGR